MTDKLWIAALANLLRRGVARDRPVPHIRVLTRNPDGTPQTWGPVYRIFGPDDWDDDDDDYAQRWRTALHESGHQIAKYSCVARPPPSLASARRRLTLA